MSERKAIADVFECMDKVVVVDEFNDRLKIQKIIYLLQEYGVGLGYTYCWYLYGPYCKAVGKDAQGYEFEPKPSATLSEGARTKIKEFNQAFKTNLNDPKWLETAASLIYLWKKKYNSRPLPEIIDSLIDDVSFGLKRFHPRLVINAIDKLENKGFFGQASS